MGGTRVSFFEFSHFSLNKVVGVELGWASFYLACFSFDNSFLTVLVIILIWDFLVSKKKINFCTRCGYFCTYLSFCFFRFLSFYTSGRHIGEFNTNMEARFLCFIHDVIFMAIFSCLLHHCLKTCPGLGTFSQRNFHNRQSKYW